MPAYLLLTLAVLSRLVPHPDWFNFTAVGGALLYFGARRSWREMILPLAALAGTDFVLTRFVYHYGFELQDYATTWLWYVAVMALGHVLLHAHTTVLRVGTGVVLGPTSFFIVSNYSVWAAGTMYPRNWDGLLACYTAALPFYRNDVASTAIVAGVAFGLPVLMRRFSQDPAYARVSK